MRVLIPLPDQDFDVTEVAVPWRVLTDAGHEVVFATERGGTAPRADPLLLTGVVFGRLGAEAEPKAFYRDLLDSPAYRAPLAWGSVVPEEFDGLVLPGGHAPGMRQYLGSVELQQVVARFWALRRPVGAICHGVLVLARAGVLEGRRTTCLPKYMERAAYFSTAWLRGRYYRTYPAYVQDEVVASGAVFERGPVELSRRGTATDDGPAFVVRDGDYVSARWPGDAYLFARTFAELLG
ncbi:type 1 glutamine amidotransferase domain-containing protein [Lentzea sp. BCCO 10_0061]|uniref:Type 1 glutamine amidotransferase domain-containing protein n=1 Tax=Lentzea sokolovensis TaxID=3095429 RepID=A0ABU4UTA2_9PSEU|nr:type 1 glutamine amidotransferase domain-containing protein [Lentzea sp. BCCO 10_0061]MDX8142008.1 type 1 glutamine amidotransferase domain-containing protein [Lentzea sp. BCCO 10_0061]